MYYFCGNQSTAGALTFAGATGLLPWGRVLTLPDDLSYGDIHQVELFATRKPALLSLWGGCGETDFIRECHMAYRCFYKQLRLVDAVQVWYSDSPMERCAFLYLMYLLRDQDVEVTAVNCSRSLQKEGCIARYKHSGEVCPEDMPLFAPFVQEVTLGKRITMAEEWASLMGENTNLRAVVDGEVQSVPMDQYDAQIFQYITEAPQKIANVIGRVIGEEGLSVGDGFIALRLRHGVAEGTLVQLGEKRRFYDNYICRSTPRNRKVAEALNQ